MDLSIIIINFNTDKLTSDCVDSIISTTKNTEYEIIIVDNSERENCCYEIKTNQADKVKLISGVKNKGFGNACNIGADKAKGKYLLFVNSDVIVDEKTIDACVDYAEKNSDIGALGVRTLLTDGKLDHGCKRGFPTPMASLYYFMRLDKKYPESEKYGAYRQTFVDEKSITQVDAVSGSFMLIPKDVYKQVSGFDEDFFMYGEDLDICYRINQLGKKIVYLGTVTIVHLRGKSGLEGKSKAILQHFYSAMIIFYKKHYKKRYNILVNGLVYTAIYTKYLLDLSSSRMKRRKK